MKTKLLMLIWATLFTSQLFADEVNLVKITNGLDSDVHALVLHLDGDDNVVKFEKAVYRGSSLKKVFDFSVRKSQSGVVLENRYGKDFVSVRLSAVDRGVDGASRGERIQEKATVHIIMLKNYLTGSTSTEEVQLVYRSGRWQLQRNGRAISKLHFERKTFGVKVQYSYK